MAASPAEADASHRRREKRRQLDARRSKCRIRLGGHMEQWCLLKEQLGFSLHSQLAKFLLDRLGRHGGRGDGGPPGVPTLTPSAGRFLTSAVRYGLSDGGLPGSGPPPSPPCTAPLAPPP